MHTTQNAAFKIILETSFLHDENTFMELCSMKYSIK